LCNSFRKIQQEVKIDSEIKLILPVSRIENLTQGVSYLRDFNGIHIGLLTLEGNQREGEKK
jgi:hypothetical protein